MKIQLSKVFNSSTVFAQGQLWSCHFPNDAALSTLDFGGSVGKGIPAINVTEPLYEITWDSRPARGGLNLRFPKMPAWHSIISITLHDHDRYQLTGEIMIM